LQLNGKGQRGKKWVFQRKKSVAFSVFTDYEIDSKKIGYLPLICGLSVKNALADINVDSSLKWPNDIIINGKKVGGVLCESRIRNGKSKNTVIGIGMNVNQNKDDIHSLNISNAGSLKTEYNKTFKREEIISSVINTLESLFLSLPGNTKKIKHDWEEACIHLNKDIELSYSSKKIKGIFRGLGVNGSGIIEKNGKLINIS